MVIVCYSFANRSDEKDHYSPLRACLAQRPCRYNSTLLKLGHCDAQIRPMRWLRYDRRIGSWLALVALVIQFGLSFGHFHPDTIQRTDAAGATLSRQAHAAKSFPTQQPSQDGDDYCAICASIYLAANSFIPVAPQLPVPSASHIVERFERGVAVCVARRRAPFQSRAPPLA